MAQITFPKRSLPQPTSEDSIVQSTNNDAATSKLAAIRLGYYEDKALELLLHGVNLPFRAPLMLRGYYIRTFIMRDIVQRFLLHNSQSGAPEKRQIVNLGAGFDTLYFWLRKNQFLSENLQYFEIDFEDVLKSKVKAIGAQQELLEQLENCEISLETGKLRANNYNIIPCDLRATDEMFAKLKEAGFNPEVPTIFLSECVLIYMKPEFSQAIIKRINEECSTAIFACYEQIYPNDSFGRVMIQNLERRGCALQGIDAFPDEDAQRRRFLETGWQRMECYNMNILYNKYINPDDRRRIERLQMLDELEEWILINNHYCIAWAFFNKNPNTNWDSLVFLPEA